MITRLEAKALEYRYAPETPVLDAVDAHVQSGVLTGIVGPNGSGKSTLLRLLCGLLRPNQGRVLLDGKPLHRYTDRHRARRLAFLPQTISPAFTLSAVEVVALGRYPYAAALSAFASKDQEIITRCLHNTDTEAFRDRDFLSLSGGERQRVLLASVLAQEPDLLLLDEPTSALDIHHEMEVFELLRRLSTEGYGIAVVTHDLNLAAQYCKELILLSHDHRVLATGSPQEVLQADILSQAYDAPILVGVHPFTQTPLVVAQARKAGA